MRIGSELGVQSYCFRGFKENAEVAQRVKEIGVNMVELCGVHADFDDPSSFDGAIATYREAGVAIGAIGVQGLSGDESRERNYFEFMKVSGARMMSVDFDINKIPQAFRVAEKLADEYDVRVGIHNHGGPHWLGCARTLQWVFDQTSERIGLCLDTAWALDSREDPVAMAERFGSRLHGVHIKDFVFDRARQPEDVIVGTGNLDLPGLLKTMDAVGFSGAVVLEYEGDVENPVPALSECVKMVTIDLEGRVL